MHFRNGRIAQNGDKVVQLGGASGAEVTHFGTLKNAVAGNDYCNGDIVDSRGEVLGIACMCDCLHVDDVAELLKEKGLDKRPAGK